LTNPEASDIINTTKQRKRLNEMAIEVIVIDENAVVIKGLRPASESAAIAESYNSRMRMEAEERAKKRDFFNRAMEEIIQNIHWASQRGDRETTATGYGCGHSVLRGWWNEYDIEAMNNIFRTMIYPVLREQGYSVKHEYCYFASKERHIDVTIKW
jgi:hypothetical protein